MKYISFKLLFYILLLKIFFFYNNNNYKHELNVELRRKKREIKNIEDYYKFCNSQIILNKKEYIKINNPKISIISPIYNKEQYILRFLKSIQNQLFDEIEIILIDDCSTDKSIKIIESLKEKDQRIILIKHKKNKGTLISRNEGAFFSRGEYLIFADPDDILSKDLLSFSYKIAKKNEYEMIRFNIYNGNQTINLDFIVNYLESRPIFQPELSQYIFYGLNELREIDYFIWNKCIKRELFIFTLNQIDEYFLNQHMIDCEDGLINFMLHRTAKSYYFIKKIGYYYILNKNSITLKSKENFKKRLKSNFLYFKFIFHYTRNNEIEKKIAEYVFFTIYEDYKSFFFELLKESNQDLTLFKDVTNLYLNCKYISLKTKKIFNKIKIILKNKII